MSQRDTVIHLVAGGVAGTVGAIVTCPLEVVKTRLQSSSSGFYPPTGHKELGSGHVTCKSFPTPQQRRRLCTNGGYPRYSMVALSHCGVTSTPPHRPPGLVACLRFIVENEGPRALFKGLGPNLVGVAPSRAIYFCTYSQSKSFFNSVLPPDSPIVHVCSASAAGFVACTATNPIWFVKTRLQLDHHANRMTALQCVRMIYRQSTMKKCSRLLASWLSVGNSCGSPLSIELHGWRTEYQRFDVLALVPIALAGVSLDHVLSGLIGFYKGITASYMGISETVVHFVIYEAVKSWLIAHRSRTTNSDGNSKTSRDFFEFMAAGAFSKTIASCVAYPHEVARTRLREEGTKYRTFWQTLSTICSEEGPRGMYRGLATQLVRQIPNTAIMMATYEAVVYVLTRHFQTSGTSSNSSSQSSSSSSSSSSTSSSSSSSSSTTQFYAEAKSKRELA